jgi:hypothetical protein
MPGEADDDLREEIEDGRAEAWAAYFGALALGVNEFEARIQGQWVKFSAAVEREARKTRRGIAAALASLPDTIDPWDEAVLGARNRTDQRLWEFKDRVFGKLGVVNSQAAEDPEAVVEVFNRRYRLDRGGPASIIGEAQEEAADVTRKAVKGLRKSVTREAALAKGVKATALDILMDPGQYRDVDGELDDLLDGLDEAMGRGDFAATASFIDNVIRAVEQKTHQESMTIVDATAGPMAVEAAEEAAELFAPAAGGLEPAFLTHQRSTFRSTIAGMGRAFDSGWPEEDVNWLYYQPITARAGLAPDGFGATHYALIRSQEEWEGVRKALDHTRPGSYIFTTGFHVNDTGYLLPIPPLLLAAAVADQRKERQRFLEKQKDKE